MSAGSKFPGTISQEDFNTFDTSVQAALKGDWKVAKALFEKYPKFYF
jgi:hypothetical protein